MIRRDQHRCRSTHFTVVTWPTPMAGHVRSVDRSDRADSDGAVRRTGRLPPRRWLRPRSATRRWRSSPRCSDGLRPDEIVPATSFTRRHHTARTDRRRLGDAGRCPVVVAGRRAVAPGRRRRVEIATDPGADRGGRRGGSPCSTRRPTRARPHEREQRSAAWHPRWRAPTGRARRGDHHRDRQGGRRPGHVGSPRRDDGRATSDDAAACGAHGWIATALDADEPGALRPVQPMLAAPSPDVTDALEQTGRAQIDWKLDGVRVQAHRVGDDVSLFTRNLNDITSRLPDVVDIVRAIRRAAISCSTVRRWESWTTVRRTGSRTR